MDIRQLSDVEVLALTIYGESRGEPIEGQVAVACVVRNRFNHDKYANYKDVCLKPEQFSCWNNNDPNYFVLQSLGEALFNNDPTDPVMRQCLFIADGVITGIILDNTHGARYYLTSWMFNTKKPEWAKATTNIIAKGSQVFFNV